MNKILKREKYLYKIRPFYDSDIIKVLTGIRRCGKSCIMMMIKEELLEKGIQEKDILYLDLDNKKNKKIKTSDQLETKIDEMIADNDFKYLFIDEIQNVNNFEELINAYNTDGNISIFITGSNSYLLSGQIATKLTGRYIEFEIFTLDFNEYQDLKRLNNLNINSNIFSEFEEYIINGGFPKALEFQSIDARRLYTKSIINEIFEKDIKKHKRIKHKSIFEKIQNYVINNFGATFSIRNISDYFYNNENISIKDETIRKYIEILENAKIIYRCNRFDCKSKKTLKLEQKYYLSDLSFII